MPCQSTNGKRVIPLNAPHAAALDAPLATELFTTTISHLTAAAPTIYHASDVNYSPAPQITAQFGDLIAPQSTKSQANCDIQPVIIHHPASIPGEKSLERQSSNAVGCKVHKRSAMHHFQIWPLLRASAPPRLCVKQLTAGPAKPACVPTAKRRGQFQRSPITTTMNGRRCHAIR
jgi:hypothetical protein